MDDFEFDVQLLVSLVEARPVLWDKTNNINKQERKDKGMDRILYVVKKNLKLWEMLKNALGEHCHNLMNTVN